MDDTKRSVPPGVELVRLRTCIRYTLEVCAEVADYCATATDVARRVDPAYAEQLTNLRHELVASQEALRTGSPAAIAFTLDALVGGVTP